MTQLRVQHLLSGLNMMLVAGVGVKAGERLSRVTLAVNTEHDTVPHCSAAQSAHQPHTGLILAEGRWGVETIEGSFT